MVPVLSLAIFAARFEFRRPTKLAEWHNRFVRISAGSWMFTVFALVTARAVEFPIMDHLKDAETLQQAKLSASEIKQILGQVEPTAYDTPASWQKELRVRRISLGSVSGLVLQGTSLLCGGTGNCQTWIFRPEGRSWVGLFRDQAPIADGFGFEQQATKGIRNLVLSTNFLADETSYSVFTYDGQTYSPSQATA